MGPGEPPRQTVLRGRNETDTLQGYGLTLPIPDALLGVNREKAQAITLAEYKLIESQFVTSYEYERAKLLMSQLPAASGMGDWANQQKNPLADLDKAILSINAATGHMPNTIIFGINAWQLLRSNTLARQVVSFNSVGLFNEDLLRMALIRPIRDIYIASMPYRDASGDAENHHGKRSLCPVQGRLPDAVRRLRRQDLRSFRQASPRSHYRIQADAGLDARHKPRLLADQVDEPQRHRPHRRDGHRRLTLTPASIMSAFPAWSTISTDEADRLLGLNTAERDALVTAGEQRSLDYRDVMMEAGPTMSA